MIERSLIAPATMALLAVSTTAGTQAAAPAPAAATLAPSRMAPMGRVDARYQSYNVEMVEVTGGRFWKPYDAPREEAPPPAPTGANALAGLDPGLFEYRPPIDLGNARLRRLAAALGPAYVRVSGSWANSTYFPDEGETPKEPPAGFRGVVTRAQWKGVVEFARAVDGAIVTSMATSAGTRGEAGVWTSAQARRVFDYTKAVGGRIAAAEFMNEPNLAVVAGAPEGYDAAAYARDFKAFKAFVANEAKDILVLGPGSVAEAGMGGGGVPRSIAMIKTADLLAATGPGVDVFSYHHYGAVSRRCTPLGAPSVSPDDALSEDWLSRTDTTLAFYRALRDRFEPGKPFWLTETADAACGGNPWASSFLDTFRYLDQLGRLARQDVRVVAHNTLVASDYGMIEERGLEPKPKYWAAVLWARLMGQTVLDPGLPQGTSLHAYAHCLRGKPGGVAVLLLNTDKTAPRAVSLPAVAEAYALSTPDLLSRRADLNGVELKLGPNDALPSLAPVPTPARTFTLKPASIAFLAFPAAANAACRE